MEPNEIIELLRKKVDHRIDIYSAPEKIDKYYKDLGLQLNEVSLSTNESGEIGASLFKILSIKAKDGATLSEKIILDYRDKGKIIEEISKEDLKSSNQENKNQLIHFIGEGCFTTWNNKFDLLNDEENQLIQQKREAQEDIMENPTAIFSFSKNDNNYISIASKENFNLGMFASYHEVSPFGILGLAERSLAKNLILINPFWIWKDK